MSPVLADPGSFRDPGGRVFIDDGRVLRAVYDANVPAYEAARDSGLLDRLIGQGRLVSSREVDPRSNPAGEGAAYLLEHERLPFVSYPYEWSFSQLRSAGLFQLDLLLDALEAGFTLSDATAYNIQFVGSEPRFIDHLSIQPYRDGAIWAGHRQFCMQFLNPLVLWSRLGVAPNAWFRGSLEGIAPEELAPLLRWRDKLSLTLASHVVAQAAAQRRTTAAPVAKGTPRALPRNAFKAMLLQLRSYIAGLRPPRAQTVWKDYDSDNSYASDEAAAKHAFVGEMVRAAQPNVLFDLGCNSGDYSLTALDNGARYVVGFDFDFGALERAIDRSAKGQLPFLPLWLDATNPSPSQGWMQAERRGFSDRARGDAVVALAFVHHLAIARNVPLGAVIEWITDVAPVGVIEFPPKSDPMVQQLLSRRPDIFPDYTEETFLAELQSRAKVTARRHLREGGRLLVAYDRR
jgi:ribosomal protein L11 methylase PrmA